MNENYPKAAGFIPQQQVFLDVGVLRDSFGHSLLGEKPKS